jgi:ribosomal protein L15
MPAGFEGGQTRLYMRLPKLPGNTSKDAMPIGPFRTRSQGVNVRDLERVFDAGAEVTPEALKAKRLIRTIRIDVKILGQGELTKKLTVSAHRVSQSAREKIEGAGGSVTLLREPKERKRKRHKKAAPAPEAEVETPDVEAAESDEPEVEAETESEPEPDEE